MGGTTVSSCFSGVDTPGVADCMMTVQLSDLVGVRLPFMEHLFAVEWNPESCEELRAHPSAPHCIFNDISKFYKPAVLQAINAFAAKGVTLSFKSFMPAVKTGNAMQRRAFCINHKRHCCAPRAKINRSGIPCVNFSPRGDRSGQDGKTMVHVAAWVGMRRDIQEPLIIVEESNFFDPEILVVGLGDMYVLEWAILCPTMFGWPVRRRRFWGILYHRVLIMKVWGSLDNVIDMFTRMRAKSLTWECFAIADDEMPKQLEDEFTLLMMRKKTEASRSSLTFAQCRENPLMAFVPSEIKYHEEYASDPKVHGAVWNLSQCHSKGCGQSTTGPVMYTVVKHPTVHFIDKKIKDMPKRMFITEELFLMQGCPVVQRLVNPDGIDDRLCCSMSVESKVRNNKDRKLAKYRGQAGDAMNTNCAFIMMLRALCFVQRGDQMDVFECFENI
eukprot:1647844-Karenia_brevis.AAC.1